MKTPIFNSLEQNKNDFVPMDKVEEALNIFADSTKSRIKKLWQVLDITREKVMKNHNIKQGIIYYNLGEEYMKIGMNDFAKACLEISSQLLEEEKRLYNSVVSLLSRIDNIESKIFSLS